MHELSKLNPCKKKLTTTTNQAREVPKTHESSKHDSYKNMIANRAREVPKTCKLNKFDPRKKKLTMVVNRARETPKTCESCKTQPA